ASNTKITAGALYKSLNDQEKFSYTLSQNFPNPFNPSTTISLKIPEITFIRLNVYDILGNEIKELLNEVMEPGTYSILFDASFLPSGIYFYRLSTSSFTITKSMILAK